jgi:glycosyltransferase involved in cell wall biosynthesis
MAIVNNGVIIIANGFQQDYIVNLIWSMSRNCGVVFIGSDEYLKYRFDNNVVFLNLRGSHDENVSVFRKIKRILKYYFRLALYLIKTDCEVLHLQWMRFYLIDGVFLSLFARLIGIKAVYTVHDVLPHDRNTLFNRLIFYLVYRSQNLLIAHTDHIKQRVLKEFKISEKKVHVVKHGVYKVNKNGELSAEDVRSKLNYNHDDFIILFFGRIARYKRVELIIKSYNDLKREHKGLKLIIAGKVPNDFKEEFENIKGENDLKGITIKTYYIDDDEVELLFRSANVTVLPYKEASQSGVLFMSYAYGVPVIVPNLGGFPDDVIQGETGLLFNPDEETSFTETLRNAINVFSQPKEEFINKIKNFAEENYSWNASSKNLFHIYNL